MYEFIHRIPHQPFPAPSRNEDEYFHRLEIERRAEHVRRRRMEREREEKERLRALHRDHCPECGSEMERKKVKKDEIRRCPSCEGVWMPAEVFRRVANDEERGSYLENMLHGMVVESTLGRLPKMESPARKKK